MTFSRQIRRFFFNHHHHHFFLQTFALLTGFSVISLLCYTTIISGTNLGIKNSCRVAAVELKKHMPLHFLWNINFWDQKSWQQQPYWIKHDVLSQNSSKKLKSSFLMKKYFEFCAFERIFWLLLLRQTSNILGRKMDYWKHGNGKGTDCSIPMENSYYCHHKSQNFLFWHP